MQNTYTQDNIHTEKVVQNRIIEKLVEDHGYRHRLPKDHYDPATAMDKQILLEFIQTTQPEEWQKLKDHYSDSTEQEFFKQLERNLKNSGVLNLLRNGIKFIPNIHFSLCYFKPASGLNQELLELYEKNILTISDEVPYSLKHKNRIDLVLFLNGIPIITIEAKNKPTGQNFKNAEHQYRKDRSPAGEPLLTFKRGALVHFALDEDQISMTTHLNNGKTFFLPFNRGSDGGAGNPDIKDDFRIAFLYQDFDGNKAIFSKEILLEIIGRFMHLFKDDKGKEIMIFPRFQQLDAVLKIKAHATRNGIGHKYLIQHSAGSGKSNTISWTAHSLINLHDADDKAIFDTVIIVTDRVVLDCQLQKNVASFAQTKGVVKKIDGGSKQLKEAIRDGARIIISTIHKFSTDHLKEVSGQNDKNFAILIDEAHSSQSGKHADNLSKALTREEEEADTIEQAIAEHQKSRGAQDNISYFAFTATPKNVTMEIFGQKDSEGKPHPFHVYSMRQAIEEGFILDVLQNYMTYGTYYKLEKSIEDDPEFTGKKAKRKIARFASLHPTAIAQKVEIIVEHFRRHVSKELDGKAKAMVVTQSRHHALSYYDAIKKYITDNNYKNVMPLVAFSGELKHEGYDKPVTEASINKFSETELPKQFDTDAYQILIVAEKYQTGFDQPKLCAMYVDKKLDGLQAVQTLSRLNRTHRGKDKTFILDFQNTTDDIKDAFKPFFETVSLEETTDPHQIYHLENKIHNYGVIDKADMQRFSEIYFKRKLTSDDRTQLDRLVKDAIPRFAMMNDDGEREEFRQLLKSFIRFYSFVSQIVTLEDTGLEKLSAYASWLVKMLPNRDVPAEIGITDDMIRLQALRIQKQEDTDASLQAGENVPLQPISEFGAKPYTAEEKQSLSEIIEGFNNRHGTEFTEEDFLRFEKVNDDIMTDDLKDMMKNNPADVVYGAFSQAFFQGMIKQFGQDKEFENIFMTDAQSRDGAIRHFFNRALRGVSQDI